MRYHFARIHKSLRVTPAMQARVSDHVVARRDRRTLQCGRPKPLKHVELISLTNPKATVEISLSLFR